MDIFSKASNSCYVLISLVSGTRDAELNRSISELRVESDLRTGHRSIMQELEAEPGCD